MDAVRKQVEELVQVELDSANEKFPMFSSMHEAYAVMKEEYDEANDEIINLENRIRWFWGNVKTDSNRVAKDNSINIKEYAINLAVEAIQLAAMAQKTIDSMSKEG